MFYQMGIWLAVATLSTLVAGSIGWGVHRLGKWMKAPFLSFVTTLVIATLFFWTAALTGPFVTSIVRSAPLATSDSWLLPPGVAWENLLNPPSIRKPESGLPNPPTAAPEAGATPAAEPGRCKQLKPMGHPAQRGELWELTAPEDSWWVVEIHSNHHDPNMESHKLLLEPGQAASFMSGGGKIWPYTCSSLAKANYRDKEMSEISQAEYDQYIETGRIP